MSEADFATEVLERSRRIPVVVDFWAAWCGPCRMLGPVLEAAVRAREGAVELAKVDTDASPGLAQAWGIRGIPAVKAFRDGEVVAEFVGARDARFVRSWLDEILPSGARRALESALAAARAGDVAGAEGGLRALLDDPEAADRAAVALAGLLLDAGRAAEAGAALDRVNARSPEHARAEALRRRLALVNDAAAYGGEEAARAALARDEADLDARWALGCALAARGETEAALAELLEIVRRNRKYRDDGARKAMLTLFEQLGADHPAARAWRRKLQIVT